MVVRFVLILQLFSVAFLFGQEVTVRASVDSADYLVGDFINYRIDVQAPKSFTVTAPTLKDSLKGVEIIEEKTPHVKEENETTITRFAYVISKYDSGDVRIPQIAVYYRTQNDTSIRSALSNDVNFTVHTLEVKTDEEIKDIKEPISIPVPWWEIALWIAGALLLVGIVILLYKRFRKKDIDEEKKPELVIPPHAIALSELRQLESEKLWQDGKIKEYHTRITEIIRKYFEGRFSFPALELTSREAIDLLQRQADAESIIDTTIEFLNNADMVKFAKYIPMNEVNIEMMKQAYSIVENTIPENRESSEVAHVQ